MLGSLSFSFSGFGLGAEKKPPVDPAPTKPVAPPPEAKSPTQLPKLTPVIVGGLGVLIVVTLLITAKGKD